VPSTIEGSASSVAPVADANASPSQEIAVALHEVKPRAGRAQAAEEAHDDAVERRLEIVVADPVLEQIAQDVERLRAGRVLFEELEEALVRPRALLAEMEIRDEERAQQKPYFAPTTVTDSMITGVFGTSRGNGPPDPVGSLAIWFITSSPDTTFPNTA